MTKVYVVVGSTGEYSDRTEWIVCAYADEALARAHVKAAEREAKRIEATNSRYNHEPDDQAKAWDAGMVVDYTGTLYWVSEVELRIALPSEHTIDAPNVGEARR